MKLKRKPKLRIKDRAIPPGPFNDLVREAIAVTKKVRPMDTVERRRLSAKALLRETMALARVTGKKVSALRSVVDGGTPGLDHTQATLRRMITFLRGPNWSGAPKDAGRLRFLSTEACNGELARLSSSPLELYCVAIEKAGEQYPEVFGKVEASSLVGGELAYLRAEQQALFAKIGTTWTANDVDAGKRDDFGNVSAATFKLSNGAVAVSPPESAGKRLVDFLIAQKKS